MKIILIGYMGSGKTSIGKILSNFIKKKFYDLDDIISNIYNININNFFYIYGNFFFRILENKILNYFLIKNYFKSYILSIGGGTPCYFNNMNLMNKLSNTIYLKNNKLSLYKRLLKNLYNRPLIKKLSYNNFFYFIINHIKKRNIIYKKSKYIIYTKNMSIKDTVNNVINVINNKCLIK
ncbi:MAG: shikimate kinase [Candidatus Shikimatogenerans bostrichidophilus]|nr:MAG: shikimate kinase [Candidatus Shikimatogenerans bostrichidophilus]